MAYGLRAFQRKHHRKRNVLATQLHFIQHRTAIARSHKTFSSLKALLEDGGVCRIAAADWQLPVPVATHARRHDPLVQVRTVARSLIGRPRAQIPGACDDPRARLGFREYLRPQHVHDFRPQPHGDHGGVREIGVEGVAVNELNAIGKPRSLRAFSRFSHQLRVHFNAPPARVGVHARGFEHNAAIT